MQSESKVKTVKGEVFDLRRMYHEIELAKFKELKEKAGWFNRLVYQIGINFHRHKLKNYGM